MANPTITEKTQWQGKTSLWFWTRSIVAIVLLVAMSGTFFMRHLIPEFNGVVAEIPADITLFIPFVPLLVAVSLLVRLLITRISAGRFRVTSTRVVERRGLAFKRINELRIEDIRGITLRQPSLPAMESEARAGSPR